jgi:hypothetical protein
VTPVPDFVLDVIPSEARDLARTGSADASRQILRPAVSG